MTPAPSVAVTGNPFVGLRPFESKDAHLFFGRDEQVDELLVRLRTQRFVAVLGSSGSGKSSLIRAGLVPALEGGFLSRAGSHWRMAVMRPGKDPIGNLARALAGPHALGTGGIDALLRVRLIETVLGRGSLGLVEAVREAAFREGEKLLIVADQFEELFVLGDASPSEGACDRAAAFVKLLIEAARYKGAPVYVVLTMRSEYLGACSAFRDLPEAINEGLFLVPRLTRDQVEQAITGPVAVAGARIAPNLVQCLLNEMGDDPDQLPLLQHALMRLWDHGCKGSVTPGILTLAQYEAIEGMQQALSRHADEAYAGLTPHQQRVAVKVFQCLTGKRPDNRETRRAATVAELCAAANADAREVTAVIESFRGEDRSFVGPPPPVVLTGETVVDITHESLIRKWGRLSGWVDQEAEDARTYVALAEAAAGHAHGEEALWRGRKLARAIEWRKRAAPGAGWASRYRDGFGEAMRFLDKSRRASWLKKGLAGVMAGVGVLGILGLERLRDEYDRAELKIAVEKGESERKLLEEKSKVSAQEARRLAAEVKARTERAERELSEMRRREAEEAAQRAEQAKQEAVNEKWLAYARLGEALSGLSPAALEQSTLMLLQVLTIARRMPAAAETAAILGRSSDRLTRSLWTAHLGGPVVDLAVSSTGRVIGVASHPRTVGVFEASTGKRQGDAGDTGLSGPIVLGPGGKEAAWASGNALFLWNTTSGTGHKWEHDSILSLGAIAVSPKGGMAVTGGSDGSAWLWEGGAGKPRRLPGTYKGRVTTITFSADGAQVAAGGRDGTILIWDVKSAGGVTEAKLQSGEEIRRVAFSGRGRYLAAAAGSRVHLWERGKLDATQMRREIGPVKEAIVRAGRINEITFSPDEHLLAAGSQDGTAAVLVLGTDRPPLEYRHDDSVDRVVFSPDTSEQRMATASRDRTVRVWRLAARTPQQLVVHDAPVSALAWASKGMLVSGDASGAVKMSMPSTGPARGQTGDADVLIQEACGKVSRLLRASEWIRFFPGARYKSPCANVPLDPNEVVRLIGMQSAAGKADAARATFAEFMGLPPERRSRTRTREFVNAALASVGDTELAKELFQLAVTSAHSRTAAENNDVCWRGSIHDRAGKVLVACDRAVELKVDEAGFRDSRGVARALLNERGGALEDFRYYVEHGAKQGKPRSRIERRARWIAEIEKGNNPFLTAKERTLEEIREFEEGPLLLEDR